MKFDPKSIMQRTIQTELKVARREIHWAAENLLLKEAEFEQLMKTSHCDHELSVQDSCHNIYTCTKCEYILFN